MGRFYVIGSFISILITVCTTNVKGSLCSAPADFPSAIPLRISNYKNWAQEIELKNVWTVTPKSAQEIVTLSNWAVKHGWKVRPHGFMHNWSPLVVTGKEGLCSRVILVDTRSMKRMKMIETKDDEPAAVRVEVGASLESLLTFLEENGKGILGHPAVGGITIGGALAIGGRGTGVPLGDLGFNHGTMSNLVKSFQAVIWDKNLKSFTIRSFDRSELDAGVLILSLGRMFLVEATLQVSPLVTFRCISRTDVSAESLFADPTKQRRKDVTLSSLIETHGAVDILWLPFTANPWLKFWSRAPVRPAFSRRTNHPFNYAFADNLPPFLVTTLNKVVLRYPRLGPLLANFQLTAASAGLLTTVSANLWGSAKNLFLYSKPTTLQYIQSGYVVITRRANIQSILHRYTAFHQELIQSYARKGLYPANGPLNIRVTGVDIGVIPGSSPPVLSSLKPVQGHPEFDTGIWFESLTTLHTANSPEFFSRLEDFVMANFSGEAVVRPEWSKGFAYTDGSSGAWSSETFLADFIPRAYGLKDWAFARKVFNQYDPHHVFTNEFLDKLFP